MKTLVATLSFVLSANAFAFATTQSVGIKQVTYQNGSWMIGLTGQLSNGCLSAPRPSAVPHPEKKNTLVLQIVARKGGDMCPLVVRAPFQLKADIRLLVQQSGIEIDPEQIYTMIAPGTDFSVSFSGADVLDFGSVPVPATSVLQ